MTVGTLVLLRHGQSEWNAKNLFTGWVDVALSEQGEQEARRGGELLADAGLLPDVLHTSLLRRAIATAQIALDACDRHWIPVRRDWRLNERHYGALQGKDKKQTMEEYGEEQFQIWRRSYDTPPPPIDPDDEYAQTGDPRYADLGDAMPRTECLDDVLERLLPVLDEAVVPDLRAGRDRARRRPRQLAARGGQAPRRRRRRDDRRAEHPHRHPAALRPRGERRRTSRPTNPGGTYLDPDAAQDAIAAVANQGR